MNVNLIWIILIDQNKMRYFVGTWLLYAIAYMGGDIIVASLWMGAAYGFIDFMKERSM